MDHLKGGGRREGRGGREGGREERGDGRGRGWEGGVGRGGGGEGREGEGGREKSYGMNRVGGNTRRKGRQMGERGR